MAQVVRLLPCPVDELLDPSFCFGLALTIAGFLEENQQIGPLSLSPLPPK